MLNILNDNTLNLTELFSSIQGESRFTGMPTTFIRTAACNLRCTWCDTTYSFGRGTETPLSDIVAFAEKSGNRHLCITGGEPLLQSKVHPLMEHFCNNGYIVSLETSGSLTIKDVDPRVVTILDVKCPGSGMESKNYWGNFELLRQHDEVKFVILDRNDYEYSKSIIDKYRLNERDHPVLFSPVYDELDPKDLIRWVLDDQLPVRLNLQIHKFIWGPKVQGV